MLSFVCIVNSAFALSDGVSSDAAMLLGAASTTAANNACIMQGNTTDEYDALRIHVGGM